MENNTMWYLMHYVVCNLINGICDSESWCECCFVFRCRTSLWITATMPSGAWLRFWVKTSAAEKDGEKWVSEWRDHFVSGKTIWSSHHFVFVTECEFCFCCFRNMEGTWSTCGRWKTSLTNWSLRSESTWLMRTLTLLGPVYFMTSPFRCPLTYSSKTLDAYSALMSDVVQTIPPELLGALLQEELTEQGDRMLFFEGATGGALAFVPFSQSRGCLLYPGSKGLDCLSILLIIQTSFKSSHWPNHTKC